MWSTITRYGGAVGVLAIGYDHYDELTVHFYSVIPKVGTLFVLDVVGAGVVALMLVAPVPSRYGRLRRLLPLIGAVWGIGLAVGSLAGLVLSETTGVFGFHEAGVRPAIELAGALDVLTIALLAAYVVLAVRARRAQRAHSWSGARNADVTILACGEVASATRADRGRDDLCDRVRVGDQGQVRSALERRDV